MGLDTRTKRLKLYNILKSKVLGLVQFVPVTHGLAQYSLNLTTRKPLLQPNTKAKDTKSTSSVFVKNKTINLDDLGKVNLLYMYCPLFNFMPLKDYI